MNKSRTILLLRCSALFLLFLFFHASSNCIAIDGAAKNSSILSHWNERAPFSYLPGGKRRWPIFQRSLPEGAKITLTARSQEQLLAEGESLQFSQLNVAITEDQYLEVRSEPGSPTISFKLEIRISWPATASDEAQKTESQTIEVRPAPPDRPLSYVSDFGDDLINLFNAASPNGSLDIEKSAFDAYFRMLQAQGIRRLIMWLHPFPFITDRENYSPEDWNLYEKQARAILECQELKEAFQRESSNPSPWVWLVNQLQLRLNKNLGSMLSDSAIDHDIRLSVSFRPFEAAVSKFINPIPVFDRNGNFLWDFLPITPPILTFDREQAGFAHYRQVVTRAGCSECVELDAIEIPDCKDVNSFLERFRSRGDNLEVLASAFPPQRDSSYVLQRAENGSFELVRYGDIKSQVENAQQVITNYTVESKNDDTIRITGLEVPDHYRYILLRNPAKTPEALDFSTHNPVELYSKAGNRLGRNNLWWVLNDTHDQRERTRVTGIHEYAGHHTVFFAVESSIEFLRQGPPRLPLIHNLLVIDRGTPWTFEIMDLNEAAMRENVVAELKTILSYPAFDEIFVNTRSHTQLAGYLGDGELGIQPSAQYRNENKTYFHLGIDLAYAPRSVADDPQIRLLTQNPNSVEKITTNQHGEWLDTCQNPDSPFVWRLARNRAIAQGFRKLLIDLENEFPGVRIRAVLPERESVHEKIMRKIATSDPDTSKSQSIGEYGQLNGLDWYPGDWRTNHIKSLSEGMAMLDLTGLAVEPVFLGIRDLPSQRPLAAFVQEFIRDMADHHGSSYVGPKSFFYECHSSLYADEENKKQQRREEIICYLLSHPEHINEVILYESAAWVFLRDISKPDSYGHSYLDRCSTSSE